MDAESYPAARMLEEYKAQQGVERGFRFLKDPWFMVDSVFLKSPRRIEALMMVMTLCLLVYNVAHPIIRTDGLSNAWAKSRKRLLGSRNVGYNPAWIAQISE